MCVIWKEREREREREWEYKDDKSKHFIDYSHRVTADSEKLVELLNLPYLFPHRQQEREKERWTEHET